MILKGGARLKMTAERAAIQVRRMILARCHAGWAAQDSIHI